MSENCKAHSGFEAKLENIESMTKETHSAICGKAGIFTRLRVVEIVLIMVLVSLHSGEKIATVVAEVLK